MFKFSSIGFGRFNNGEFLALSKGIAELATTLVSGWNTGLMTAFSADLDSLTSAITESRASAYTATLASYDEQRTSLVRKVLSHFKYDVMRTDDLSASTLSNVKNRLYGKYGLTRYLRSSMRERYSFVSTMLSDMGKYLGDLSASYSDDMEMLKEANEMSLTADTSRAKERSEKVMAEVKTLRASLSDKMVVMRNLVQVQASGYGEDSEALALAKAMEQVFVEAKMKNALRKSGGEDEDATDATENHVTE